MIPPAVMSGVRKNSDRKYTQKKGITHYHAQLGSSNKVRANKELVVCRIWLRDAPK